MGLTLRNLFWCQYEFLRIQTPIIRSFFNTRGLYFRCGARTQSNW